MSDVRQQREAWYDSLTSQPKLLSGVQERATAWCGLNGLVMGTPQGDLRHAPVTLLPHPFPRELFERVTALAPALNELFFAISNDHDWLLNALKHTVLADPFTARLVELWNKTKASGSTKRVRVMMTRSDYMLHAEEGGYGLRQVEMNTIAASFACLSERTGQLHRFVDACMNPNALPESAFPTNNTINALPNALATAWKAFGNDQGVVVFLVQEGERNSFDQEWLQQKLWENHKIRTLRLTHLQVHNSTTLAENGDLVFEGKVISVIYMRSGYTPSDYPSEECWLAREKMELSTAALCPDIAQHLSGAKKIQNELARPGQVERFFPHDPEVCRKIRSVFAGFHGFDPEEEQASVKVALAAPSKFVLKPQREGGGNNLYDDDLKKTVEELQGTGELRQFILMERLTPPTERNLVLRDNKVIWGDMLPELGVYGLSVYDGDKMLLGEVGGYLLRSKFVGVNDGGVAAGNANLDGIVLV